MPQAVKNFAGNSGSTTVYTCPADTVALVIPNITLTPTAQYYKHSICWNSSSVASASVYNIYMNDPPSSIDFRIQAEGKYQSRFTYTGSTNVYYRAGPTGTIITAPSNMLLGHWSMSAGHKLSLYTEAGGDFTYSFLILEEVAG